jgi:hypothetical protein
MKKKDQVIEGKIEDMAEVVRVVMNSHPSLIFSRFRSDDILCFLQTTEPLYIRTIRIYIANTRTHYDFGRKILFEISEEEAFKIYVTN